MVDSRAGLCPADFTAADWLRRSLSPSTDAVGLDQLGSIPVIVVANKCDHPGDSALVSNALEAASLGFGNPVPYSAETQAGSADLYDALRPVVDAALERTAAADDLNGHQDPVDVPGAAYTHPAELPTPSATSVLASEHTADIEHLLAPGSNQMFSTASCIARPEEQAHISPAGQPGHDRHVAEMLHASKSAPQGKGPKPAAARRTFGGWQPPAPSTQASPPPTASTPHPSSTTLATRHLDVPANPPATPQPAGSLQDQSLEGRRLPADDMGHGASEADGAGGTAGKQPTLGVHTPIKLVLVGLPNAGKSTLINRLLGYERALVGPEAALTRDAITERLEWRGTQFEVTDTAGWLQRAVLKSYDDSGGSVARMTVAQVCPPPSLDPASPKVTLWRPLPRRRPH